MPDGPLGDPLPAGTRAPQAAETKAAETKAGLRRSQAARRRRTDPRASLDGALGERIARQVLALPETAAAARVAAFVSLPGEPSTLPLLDALRARGIQVLLPVVRGDLDLDFREYGGTLLPGALGTREPPPAAALADLATVDVALVPAVAVDTLGHRLGRGGGSYDRALRRARPGTLLVALVDEYALVPAVPVAAHDLSVSVIVTPSRVVRCPPV